MVCDKAFTVDYGNRHQQACSPDCRFELRRVAGRPSRGKRRWKGGRHERIQKHIHNHRPTDAELGFTRMLDANVG